MQNTAHGVTDVPIAGIEHRGRLLDESRARCPVVPELRCQESMDLNCAEFWGLGPPGASQSRALALRPLPRVGGGRSCAAVRVRAPRDAAPVARSQRAHGRVMPSTHRRPRASHCISA